MHFTHTQTKDIVGSVKDVNRNDKYMSFAMNMLIVTQRSLPKDKMGRRKHYLLCLKTHIF